MPMAITTASPPPRWMTRHCPASGTRPTPLIEDELRAKDTLGSAFREPIYSFMPSPQSYLRDILEKVRASKEAEWEAVAPSSLAFYNHDALPEWRNSLLITILKGGCVYRLPLTDDGRRVNGTPEKLFDERVRYHDITVSPDSKIMRRRSSGRQFIQVSY